jgi:hypothetical protein
MDVLILFLPFCELHKTEKVVDISIIIKAVSCLFIVNHCGQSLFPTKLTSFSILHCLSNVGQTLMSPFVVSVQVDGIQSLAFFHLQSGYCRNKVLCMTFVILSHFNNGSHVRLIRLITFTVI